METQGYKSKKIQNQWKGSTNISTNSLSVAPHLIFEKFLTNAGLMEICNQSNKYAESKENHTFNLTLEVVVMNFLDKKCFGKEKKIVTMSWH